MNSNLLITKDILPILQQVFPPLEPYSKKGQNGRIAVIGGSYEFTGAPFYSAITSLKAGGDIAHIFCSKSAATPIKSYSPQIIVHPVFVSSEQAHYSPMELQQAYNDWLNKIMIWKSAIYSWVIGPGLGRDKYMHGFFPYLVTNIPSGSLVIFDADGIYFLTQHPHLLDELKRFRTVLTPNAREMSLLKTVISLDIDILYESNKSQEQIQEIPCLQKNMDFSLFIKGREDLILTNKKSFIVRTLGGNKRSGGIGDIVSGLVAVCGLWNEEYGLVLASRIAKIATRVAFQKQGRGLTAPNIIKQLPMVVAKIESASL